MGSLAAQFLLESLLAPFAAAALLLTLARWLPRSRFAALGPVFAMMLALGTTYVLAFGWPSSHALDARTKILISAVLGAIMGLIVERRDRTSTVMLIAGATAIIVWIGLPALVHGRPASALLLLPIAVALAALRLFGRGNASDETPPILTMLTLAFGLAAIAVFAKTFSLAQIALSLASALLAVLIFGRPALSSPGAKAPVELLTSAMLLALSTALLLYSEANVFAVIILATTLIAGRLASRSGEAEGGAVSIPRHVVFRLLPAAAAILIARIDAGPISLY